MAEGKGFEPSVACATHAFQACSFDRSDTPLWQYGGRGTGIRTLGSLRYNGFQDRRFRPLSHPPKEFPSIFSEELGGDTRIRTGDQGFAGPCLTTWLCRPLVPGAGLEPARTDVRGILSPLRLPIPPSGPKPLIFRKIRIALLTDKKDLYQKWSGRRDSNPRPQPWQGCALPLSYSRVFWDRYYSPNFFGCKGLLR